MMQKRAARQKRFRIPTPENLANIALFYLERFAASEASLRRVLTNRIRRAAMVNPDFAADRPAQEKLQAVIDEIVATHKRTGVINDEAFAKMKVESLRRGGRSTRAIAQKLQQKGIAKNLTEKALEEERQEDTVDIELRAARIFAKKKGINAEKIATPEKRKRVFASFARAGFSYDIIQQVVGVSLEEDEFF